MRSIHDNNKTSQPLESPDIKGWLHKRWSSKGLKSIKMGSTWTKKRWLLSEWPTPKSVSELRSFHGLTSFYRRFLPNFSTIAFLSNELVKKSVEFKWGIDQTKAFETLKEKLINAPLIAFLTFSRHFKLSVMHQMWVLRLCFSMKDTSLLNLLRSSRVVISTTLVMTRSFMLL